MFNKIEKKKKKTFIIQTNNFKIYLKVTFIEFTKYNWTLLQHNKRATKQFE